MCLSAFKRACLEVHLLLERKTKIKRNWELDIRALTSARLQAAHLHINFRSRRAPPVAPKAEEAVAARLRLSACPRPLPGASSTATARARGPRAPRSPTAWSVCGRKPLSFFSSFFKLGASRRVRRNVCFLVRLLSRNKKRQSVFIPNGSENSKAVNWFFYKTFPHSDASFQFRMHRQSVELSFTRQALFVNLL